MEEEKYYWLGPGSLKAEWQEDGASDDAPKQRFKRKIKPDNEIPQAVIDKMSKGKLKSFLDAKKIANEPRSAALLKVARNARNKIGALENDNKEIVSKFDKIIKKKDAIIESLKEKFKRKTEDFNKSLKAPADLEKENQKLLNSLEKAVKDREKALDEAKSAIEDYKAIFKENASLKKTMNDLQKKYKTLQKERDLLKRSLEKKSRKQ